MLQGSKEHQKAEEKGETKRVRTIKTVMAVISLILIAALIGYLVFMGSRVPAEGQILPVLKTLAEVAYDKTACI